MLSCWYYNIVQDTVGCLCCLCTLLASSQLAVHQVLCGRPVPCQPVTLSPARTAACIVSFPFVLVEFHTVLVSPFLQVQFLWMAALLLGVSMAVPIWCKPDESLLHCLLQVIDKELLNRTGPITDSCSTQFVTGLWVSITCY